MKNFRKQCTLRCEDFDELEAQEINLLHKWAKLEIHICDCIDAFHFVKFGYKDSDYTFSFEENLIYVVYEKSGVYLEIPMEFFEDPENSLKKLEAEKSQRELIEDLFTVDKAKELVKD